MSNKLGPWIAKPDGQGGWIVVENRVEMWLDESDIGIDWHDLMALQGTQWRAFPAMTTVATLDMSQHDKAAWLIAAAPDLLDACEAALAERPAPNGPGRYTDQVRNALAAAIDRAKTGHANGLY
jgi:hypothetical protein